MELVSEAKKAKVHSLIDKVYHPTNLRLAWKKVREDRGAGGVDQISVDVFQENVQEELRSLHEELMQGCCWIVDADLRDYFGSVPHEKLIDLVAEKVSDGRVLKLIRQKLKAGDVESGQQRPTPQGTPQGGVISPLLSNIYLTSFDNELTKRGYRLTRYCDD